MKLHLLTLLASASLLSVASAQYLGSNDFSSAAGGIGEYSITANAGTYTVEEGRLEYSSSLAATSRVLNMNGGANSAYNEDWTARLSLTNLTTPVAGYSLIGLQVFSSTADYGFFNVGLYRSSSGTTGILFEKARTTDGTANTYTLASYISSQADLSDVVVLMSHNATTKDITLGYSLDGGATFVDSAVFNPNATFTTSYGADTYAGNWFATPSTGYSFRVLARSTGTDLVDGNTLFADDFSVTAGTTAIPEPSTYAALAGLGALGLALWRRRRANFAS